MGLGGLDEAPRLMFNNLGISNGNKISSLVSVELVDMYKLIKFLPSLTTIFELV